uniref:hypothetical protein n=1 Tax=Agathobacter sp. TaxID=2021311 RepID=UPI004055C544
MNHIGNIAGTKNTYEISGNNRKKSAKKWQLSASLKEKIKEFAKKDAKKGDYMGKEFKALRSAEVAKVAPNRAALIRQIGLTEGAEKIKNAENAMSEYVRWLCMLLDIPYEVESTGAGAGACKHVYDENGDEILTYTPGVGWKEKPSKLENQVHAELKFTYYEAYHEARQGVKKEYDKEVHMQDGIMESHFDALA